MSATGLLQFLSHHATHAVSVAFDIDDEPGVNSDSGGVNRIDLAVGRQGIFI